MNFLSVGIRDWSLCIAYTVLDEPLRMLVFQRFDEHCSCHLQDDFVLGVLERHARWRMRREEPDYRNRRAGCCSVVNVS